MKILFPLAVVLLFGCSLKAQTKCVRSYDTVKEMHVYDTVTVIKYYKKGKLKVDRVPNKCDINIKFCENLIEDDSGIEINNATFTKPIQIGNGNTQTNNY